MMHPLWHLVPLIGCTAACMTLWEWLAADLNSGAMQPTYRSIGWKIPFSFAVLAAGAIISAIPVAVWKFGGTP